MILLNFARPQNIGPICKAVAEALPRSPILILDHAPTSELRLRDDIPWDRVWYRRPKVNGRAGARIRLAAEMPFDQYIAIDDDVLITPFQVRGLRLALAQQPDRPHGIAGRKLWRDENGRIFRDDNTHYGAVDMIHMVYGFSRDQARRTMELAADVGFGAWEQVRFGDDILLCASSQRRAFAHDLGRLELCPTNTSEGIAIQSDPAFKRRRAELLRRLHALGRLKLQPRPPPQTRGPHPTRKTIRIA